MLLVIEIVLATLVNDADEIVLPDPVVLSEGLSKISTFGIANVGLYRHEPRDLRLCSSGSPESVSDILGDALRLTVQSDGDKEDQARQLQSGHIHLWRSVIRAGQKLGVEAWARNGCDLHGSSRCVVRSEVLISPR